MIWSEVWSTWQDNALKLSELGLFGQGQGRQCCPDPSAGFPKNVSIQLQQNEIKDLLSIWSLGQRSWSVKCGTEFSLPLTEMSCCEVSAASAFSRAGIAEVCMAVTLTGGAAGEAPLARLTVRALPPGGSLSALTLACNWVTLVAQWAVGVAVTGWVGEFRGLYSVFFPKHEYIYLYIFINTAALPMSHTHIYMKVCV